MSQKKKKYKKKPLRPPTQKAEGKGRNPDGTFAAGNNFAEIYQEEYADMLLDFFSQPLTRTEYIRTFKDGNVTSEKPLVITNDFPTMGMFARSIGVSVSALQVWAGIKGDGKHNRFATAYARALEWAGGMMESGALTGRLDSNMAKFVLSNDYGMNEKHDVTYTVSMSDEIDEESN